MYTDIIKAQTEILQKCGSLAIDMNKLPLALEVLKKTLEIDPLNLKTLLLLSNTYLKSSSFINVIHLLITAVNSKSKTILNNVMIWHKLAISYYRLNRFDDSNHAILQAVALFEKTKRYKFVMNNNKEISNQNEIVPKENNDPNSKPIKMFNNNNNNNNNIQNNKTIPSSSDHKEDKDRSIKDKNENLIISLSERKMYLLRCRILLLMDNRHGTLHEGLPAFDKCLYFLERVDDLNYYLDVLITRAQFFKKFNSIVNCKNDLVYVLRLLDERRHQLKLTQLLTKVSYTYSLLASIIYEENPNNYNEAIRLVRDGMKKFPHMTSTMKPLSILETQLIYLGGNDQEIADRIARLKIQITLESHKYQATTSYMIARLLIKQNLKKNMNEAYEYYQKTLKLLPKRPWIWISGAALYLELGQFDDALSTYTQAVNHSLYNDDNQSDKSEKSFSDDSSISSNSSGSNNLLPAYEMKFNNFFAAIAWFGISQVYTATGEYKNAIDAINQALKLFKIEKDSESVNKLKALLSKLIILEVNDTGENSREQNKNESSVKKQPNILNNPTEEQPTNQNSPDTMIRYEKPEVPIFLLIDLMNHRDGKLFKSIETIEKEDICSMRAQDLDEDLIDVETDSIKSEVIDLTSNENNGSHNGKRSRVEWESEKQTNGNDAKNLQTPYYYSNPISSTTKEPYYQVNLHTQQGLPSSSTVTTDSYNGYKIPMHTGTYDPRYNFQPRNSYAQPDRIESYNAREVINDVMSHYEHSQYSSSSHPTPIQTKRQIISMPVFIPDPRQSLPASTINTPVVPYEPNNAGFVRPYTAGITPNSYIHGDPQFAPNQPQIDYNNNNNNNSRIQPSQMTSISNVGPQMIHQRPSQVQYQANTIQYQPNSATDMNQFQHNGQNNGNTSNRSVTQSNNLQNQPPMNGNTFYMNPNNPPGSLYYK